MGALDAALDDIGLGVSYSGHRARQLVGLLRARLGWLAGSGIRWRNALFYALACGHGARAFLWPSMDKRGLSSRAGRCSRDSRLFVSLLGTFLVRSGCSYPCIPLRRTPRAHLILVFHIIMIGGSLTLYAWRGRSCAQVGRFLSSVRARSFLLLQTIFYWSIVLRAIVLRRQDGALIADAAWTADTVVGSVYRTLNPHFPGLPDSACSRFCRRTAFELERRADSSESERGIPPRLPWLWCWRLPRWLRIFAPANFDS